VAEYPIMALPLAIYAFLVLFASVLWWRQYKSQSADRGNPTLDQSDRVYKHFEFFVTVSLAITAGIGYVRFEQYEADNQLARQAMVGLGFLELVVATSFSIFIIILQGSKLRRWKNVEWGKLVFWLELWMCIAMMFVGTFVWKVSHWW
jgi:hypothetical protein